MMPFRESLAYAMRVVSRIFSVFIALPATSAAVALALTSNFSFYEFSYDMVEFVRGASPSATAEALASEAAAQLSVMYWVVVIIGIGVRMLVMGPRDFFMMEPRIDQGGAIKSSRDKQ